jgi:hypothetical protein
LDWINIVVPKSGYEKPALGHCFRGIESLYACRLEEACEFLLRHVAIAENLRHEARADGFSRMHRNNGHTAICMLKKMMAPPNSNRFKSGYGEGANDLSSGQSWEAAHEAMRIV